MALVQEDTDESLTPPGAAIVMFTFPVKF